MSLLWIWQSETILRNEMIEKEFEGKPWDLMNDCRNYMAESLGIEKEYEVIIKIREL